MNIGDKMIHQREGACLVTQIVEKEICGVVNDYYVLAPLLDKKASIFISKQNAQKSRIRTIITLNELEEADKQVDALPFDWIADSKKRFDHYTKTINSFHFREVLAVYKILLIQNSQNILNPRDNTLLLTAEKLICSELALLLNQDYDSVVNFRMKQYLSQAAV